MDENFELKTPDFLQEPIDESIDDIEYDDEFVLVLVCDKASIDCQPACCVIHKIEFNYACSNCPQCEENFRRGMSKSGLTIIKNFDDTLAGLAG